MDETPTTSPAAEDPDLVVRARTDREAFGELCNLYYPRIFRYCRRRLFRWDDAEEVTGDVFLSVARAMHGFAGATHDDFVRWIHAIATNEVNSLLRKTERRARLLVDAAQSGALHVPGAATGELNVAVLEWPVVHAALMRLSVRDQSIIVLRFFEGMTHRQVADILEMRPGAVRTAELRALAKMRRDLGVEP